MNAFERGISELTLQYKACHEQKEKGPNKGVKTTEVPYVMEILGITSQRSVALLHEYIL